MTITGANLKDARKAAGMSQVELATKSRGQPGHCVLLGAEGPSSHRRMGCTAAIERALA